MELHPGDLIERYSVLGLVGAGGMATVYRVRQEGRLQARLRHPTLVPVTDVLDVRGVPGLLMDFVDGPHDVRVDELSARDSSGGQEGTGTMKGLMGGWPMAGAGGGRKSTPCHTGPRQSSRFRLPRGRFSTPCHTGPR